MLRVRRFNPQTDAEQVARLNDWSREYQDALVPWYEAAVFPQNLVLVEDAETEEIVGCVHVYDAGFPWAILDGFYLKPAYRGLENARFLGRAAEEVLRQRGVPAFYVYAPERLAKGLEVAGKMTPLTGPLFSMLIKSTNQE